MDNIAFLAIQAFVLTIPAFSANSLAVITGGYGKMDFNRNFIDGKRILGDGKTWSGFIGGSLLASVAGLIIYSLDYIKSGLFYPYGSSISYAFILILSMSFSALVGDAIGSFTKRRIGLNRGANGSLLDQLPFILFTLLILYLFFHSFFTNVYGNIVGLVTVIIVTPPLHRAVNVIGYRMKKKEVPW
ncbi:MAG: CDP-2,3-bis-(O-geranylgeranyl)-sn-glycerol synthase [Thermoplasmataceae archaeon]|jgi:CDP-2,3-bis-(O-geranylgeranyl)-sn-glycerol synthase